MNYDEKVFEIRKRLVKKQEVTNEDFEALSFKQIISLCRILAMDLNLAFDSIEEYKK